MLPLRVLSSTGPAGWCAGNCGLKSLQTAPGFGDFWKTSNLRWAQGPRLARSSTVHAARPETDRKRNETNLISRCVGRQLGNSLAGISWGQLQIVTAPDERPREDRVPACGGAAAEGGRSMDGVLKPKVSKVCPPIGLTPRVLLFSSTRTVRDGALAARLDGVANFGSVGPPWGR